MKIVTRFALTAAAIGAGLVLYLHLPVGGLPPPFAFQEWTGWALIASALLMIMWRIGFGLLFGTVAMPIVVAVLAVLLYDGFQASGVFASLRAAMAGAGLEIGVQVQMFAGTTSTIYALLVAFLVFTAMQDHNNINAALQDEAMHLDSMSQILPHLHDQSGPNAAAERRMHELLIRYSENIFSKQFAHEGHMAENQRIIDSVIDEIYRLEVRDDSDRVSLGALVKRVDQLASLRARRITYMESRPAPLMLVLLVVLSVMVVAPYFLFEGAGAVTAQLFIAAIGFATTYLFAMLIDMFSHFHGYWAVDRSAFSESRDRIADRLRKLNAAPPQPRARLAS